MSGYGSGKACTVLQFIVAKIQYSGTTEAGQPMNINEPQRSHAEIWILLASWDPYSQEVKYWGYLSR